MTLPIQAVLDALETWAPLRYAYDWDKPGLSIGDPTSELRKVLVCLTVTREVFDAAKRTGANLVVSHHPLLMEPLKTLRTDNPRTRLCLDFAQAGIACYSAHTNLDTAPGGVNWVLGNALGLRNPRPLLPGPHADMLKLVTFVPESHLAPVRDAVAQAGAGVIGEYTHCSFSSPGTGAFKPGSAAKPFSGAKNVVNEEPEHRFETLLPKPRLNEVLTALFRAHPYEEVAYDLIPLENKDPAVCLGVRGELPKPLSLETFAKHVRDALAVSHVRVVGFLKRRIHRVAVLGGSGAGEIDGLPGDIDVYVTGDVKYHDALTARARNLAVIDAGHAATEALIVPVIATFLKQHFPSLKVLQHREAECFTVLGQ